MWPSSRLRHDSLRDSLFKQVDRCQHVAVGIVKLDDPNVCLNPAISIAAGAHLPPALTIQAKRKLDGTAFLGMGPAHGTDQPMQKR